MQQPQPMMPMMPSFPPSNITTEQIQKSKSTGFFPYMNDKINKDNESLERLRFVIGLCAEGYRQQSQGVKLKQLHAKSFLVKRRVFLVTFTVFLAG